MNEERLERRKMGLKFQRMFLILTILSMAMVVGLSFGIWTAKNLVTNSGQTAKWNGVLSIDKKSVSSGSLIPLDQPDILRPETRVKAYGYDVTIRGEALTIGWEAYISAFSTVPGPENVELWFSLKPVTNPEVVQYFIDEGINDATTQIAANPLPPFDGTTIREQAVKAYLEANGFKRLKLDAVVYNSVIAAADFAGAWDFEIFIVLVSYDIGDSSQTFNFEITLQPGLEKTEAESAVKPIEVTYPKTFDADDILTVQFAITLPDSDEYDFVLCDIKFYDDDETDWLSELADVWEYAFYYGVAPFSGDPETLAWNDFDPGLLDGEILVPDVKTGDVVTLLLRIKDKESPYAECILDFCADLVKA